MIAAHRLVIGSLGFVLCTQLLYGQSRPHYREFQLGGDLARHGLIVAHHANRPQPNKRIRMPHHPHRDVFLEAPKLVQRPQQRHGRIVSRRVQPREQLGHGVFRMLP